MRYFAVFCRHVVLCTLFAALTAFVFLSIEDWICNGRSGAQAAGGGAAVGMLSLAVSAGAFLLMMVTSLIIDALKALGLLDISYKAGHEVAVYSITCVAILALMGWLIYTEVCGPSSVRVERNSQTSE
jgi:hypothetical protein